MTVSRLVVNSDLFFSTSLMHGFPPQDGLWSQNDCQHSVQNMLSLQAGRIWKKWEKWQNRVYLSDKSDPFKKFS